MKCFVHIGTEKTATTTIQKFFHLNKEIMLNNGYIYTQSTGSPNNRGLSVAAYNLSRRDDFTRQHKLDSDQELLLFQNKMILKLKKEINLIMKDFPDSGTIIFSSEHFQSRLTDINEIIKLKKILNEFNIDDIKIILYLRRPADIANSLYSTAIRSGSTIEAPHYPNNPYWNNVCNHRRTIERFSTVFGDKNIIPRIFDKKEFVNGSIIDDILSIIDMPNRDYIYPKNANESLSALGVEILRRLNNIVPMWIKNKPNKNRANLVSYIQRHFSDSKYIMPEKLYEAYDLEFEASNEWVRNKYFPNRKTLFGNKLNKQSDITINDSDLDKIANLIANIWNDKQEMINKLEEKN
ncbi:MAG: hypothetical protein PQJ59_03015 [Spirochaetales bacterium]|nr:hypothetical protein [Spirochaetales bacterium]